MAHLEERVVVRDLLVDMGMLKSSGGTCLAAEHVRAQGLHLRNERLAPPRPGQRRPGVREVLADAEMTWIIWSN